MRLFVDTNIILEYIEHRREYDHVRSILAAIRDGKHHAIISQGCVYTLAYLIEKSLKANNIHKPELTKHLRRLMTIVLNMVRPVGISYEDMIKAIDNDSFTDLEDSFQYQCALENHCDVLLTINIDDFANADQQQLQVLTPAQFVKTYLKTER